MTEKQQTQRATVKATVKKGPGKPAEDQKEER